VGFVNLREPQLDRSRATRLRRLNLIWIASPSWAGRARPLPSLLGTRRSPGALPGTTSRPAKPCSSPFWTTWPNRCGGRGLSLPDAVKVTRYPGEAGISERSNFIGKRLLTWFIGGGINPVSCAGNSLSRPLGRASDSHLAISAFEWWAV
jgi:hypothetical protein